MNAPRNYAIINEIILLKGVIFVSHVPNDAKGLNYAPVSFISTNYIVPTTSA